jgi:CTP:molybdopterin cytidylyltransferase MocA
MTLSGDRGAQALLKDAIPVSASAGSLADIDTRRDLETVLKPREPKPA